MKVKRSFLVLSLVILGTLLAACMGDDGPATEDPTVTSVTIDGGDLDLAIGATTQLSATVEVEGDAAQTVTWSSDSDSITVSESGLVTVMTSTSLGVTADITATSTFDDSVSDTVTVTVVEGNGVTPSVTSVSINESDVTVAVEGTIQLSATVEVEGNAAQTVTWSSDSEDITVDASGLVTASTDAEVDSAATITATSTVDPSKSDTVAVTVVEAAGETEVTLTVESRGNGASKSLVVVDSRLYTKPVTFEAGTEVTLEYRIDGASQDSVEFIGWSNACSSISFEEQRCTLTIAEDTTVTAVFADDTQPKVISTIAAAEDDAEEYLQTSSSNSTAVETLVDLDSSDLDLTYDTLTNVSNLVGLRFAGIDLPENAEVLYAYIQFRAQKDSPTVSETTPPLNLVIRGQAEGTASSFIDVQQNLSARPKTEASVTWSPDSWLISDRSPEPKEATPDLSRIVTEIAERDDWDGDTMAFFVAPPQNESGDYQFNELNYRIADSKSDNPDKPRTPAQLVIVYEEAQP